jgi:hypothetical protein
MYRMIAELVGRHERHAQRPQLGINEPKNVGSLRK